jgi:hypothetical protein
MLKYDKTKLVNITQLVRRVNMSILEFLQIPPSPFQRPTKQRAGKKDVRDALSKLRPEHLEVAIAELTEDVYDDDNNLLYKAGTRFVNNGNTRAYYWRNCLTDAKGKKDYKSDVAPNMVYAAIYPCRNLEEVRANYFTFDSPTAVEKDAEKLAGLLLNTHEFQARSDVFKKGRFLSSLGWACHCYDSELYPNLPSVKIQNAPGMLALYIEEIKHLDSLMLHKKKNPFWDSPSISGTLMALKKYGTKNKKLNEFIKKFDSNKKKTDTDEGFDGVTHILEEWQSCNLFPDHHPYWERVMVIGNQTYDTGFNKTVSFFLYWLEKYMNDEKLYQRGAGWDKTCDKFFDNGKIDLYNVFFEEEENTNVVRL